MLKFDPFRSFYPRSTYEILTLSFEIYFENFFKLIMISAMTMIPTWIIAGAVRANVVTDSATIVQDENVTISNVNLAKLLNVSHTAEIAGLIVMLMGILVCTAIMCVFTADTLMDKNPGVESSLAGSGNRLVDVMIATVLAMVLIFGIIILLDSVLKLFIPAISLGIYSVIAFSLLIPVITFENVSFFRGMLRAVVLANSRFWQIFWLGIVFMIVAFIFGFVVGFVIGLIMAILGSSPESNQTAIGFTSLVLYIVFIPAPSIATALFYFDTRTRMQDMRESLRTLSEERGTTDIQILDLPVPPVATKINLRYAANFALITMSLYIVLALLLTETAKGFEY